MTYYDIRIEARRPPHPVRVLLDGKDVLAIAANDVNGWVEVYQTGPDGSPKIFDKDIDPHLDTELLYGIVEFKELT